MSGSFFACFHSPPFPTLSESMCGPGDGKPQTALVSGPVSRNVSTERLSSFDLASLINGRRNSRRMQSCCSSVKTPLAHCLSCWGGGNIPALQTCLMCSFKDNKQTAELEEEMVSRCAGVTGGAVGCGAAAGSRPRGPPGAILTPVFFLTGESATFPISRTFSLPGSSKPAATPFSTFWDTTRRRGEPLSAHASSHLCVCDVPQQCAVIKAF